MAVYTSLSQPQIESFLSRYKLPSLIAFSGISAGIENTNYLLNTAQGDFVLTLYEHFSADEAQVYLDLLVQLGKYKSYYPSPLLNLQQEYLHSFAGRPAAVFKCLPGASIQCATVNQCELVAKALAELHLSSPYLGFEKKNARNIEWMQKTKEQVNPHLSKQDAMLLEDELNYQYKTPVQHLAQGLIHADLFKDNVLFVRDDLTGVLDFYTACCDFFLLDVAIAMNDWCVDAEGVFERKLQAIFIEAYSQVRFISQQEALCLPLLLRRASLRFWLSRLEHKLHPREGEITQEKDPQLFKHLLLQHRKFYM